MADLYSKEHWSITREAARMASLPKIVLYSSIGVMGVVAILTVADFLMPGGLLFAQNWSIDFMFLAASGLIIYLAIDALAEQK